MSRKDFNFRTGFAFLFGLAIGALATCTALLVAGFRVGWWLQ